MTGLNKANSTYAWSTVTKDERYINITYTTVHKSKYLSPHRWYMRVTEETYNTPPPTGKARTLTLLHTNCTFSRPSKHLGSKDPPLLALEPSQYVLDELHLLLRVADIFVWNIIHLEDHLDLMNQLRGGRTGTHISRLEDVVKSCGVGFRISPVSQSITKSEVHVHVLVMLETFTCRMRMAELWQECTSGPRSIVQRIFLSCKICQTNWVPCFPSHMLRKLVLYGRYGHMHVQYLLHVHASLK